MQNTKRYFFRHLTNELHRSIYEFEQKNFSPFFLMTPNDYEEFKQMRPISKLSASLAIQGDEIISLIVNEKLANEHVQSIIVGTKAKYRKSGFLKSIIKINFDGLRSMGFKFISFWSYPESPLFKVYSEHLECISKDQVLTGNEIKLRNDYFKARKVEPLHSGIRIVNNFYKLKNNTTSPASFWIFRIG